MLFQNNVSNRYPLAPPELPGFTATMDNSDLHESHPLLSWVRLVPRGSLHGGGFMDLLCYRSLPISGSKCSKTPGCPPVLAIYAQVAFACAPFNTIGLSQYVNFGAPSLQGRHSPLPLFLARFPAYASTSMLSWRLQGWILCPWLAVTQVGFPPTGLNDIAEPQLKHDLHCGKVKFIAKIITETTTEV